MTYTATKTRLGDWRVTDQEGNVTHVHRVPNDVTWDGADRCSWTEGEDDDETAVWVGVGCDDLRCEHRHGWVAEADLDEACLRAWEWDR